MWILTPNLFLHGLSQWGHLKSAFQPVVVVVVVDFKKFCDVVWKWNDVLPGLPRVVFLTIVSQFYQELSVADSVLHL